jgi:hypothetical protein
MMLQCLLVQLVSTHCCKICCCGVILKLYALVSRREQATLRERIQTI